MKTEPGRVFHAALRRGSFRPSSKPARVSEEVARGDGEEETLVNSVSLLLHLNSPRDPLRLRLDSRKSSVAGVEDVFFEDPKPHERILSGHVTVGSAAPPFCHGFKENKKNECLLFARSASSVCLRVFFFVLCCTAWTWLLLFLPLSERRI